MIKNNCRNTVVFLLLQFTANTKLSLKNDGKIRK